MSGSDIGFSRGDVLLRARPFAFIIIKEYRSISCENCWTHSKEGFSVCCQQCKLVFYCSQECYSDGRAEHAEECQVLSRADEKIKSVPDQLRLVLRIWIKLGKDGSDTQETENGVTRCWNDLMDHASDLKRDSISFLQQQFSMLSYATNSCDMPTMEDFISIYGKILTNSFSLRTDRFGEPNSFGTGIYLLPSILDHSCLPNCTVVFKGRELLVMATENIPAGNIDKVAKISYVNVLEDTAKRQLQNRAIWYFQCQCSLCHNSSLDQGKHCVVCDECGGDRPVLCHPIMDSEMLLRKCETCKYSNAAEDKKLLQRYNRLCEKLRNEAGGTGWSGEELTWEELCEYAVGEMEDFFSKRDILYLKTVHYVHTACIQSERWSAAALYGEKVLPHFRFYYGKNAGVVAGLLVRLGIAYSKSGEDEKAENCFLEADEIYRIIPGEKHPFYTEDFQNIFRKYITN